MYNTQAGMMTGAAEQIKQSFDVRADFATLTKGPSLATALEQLSKNLALVNEHLSRLESRLGPVSGSPVRAETGVRALESPPGSAPVVTSIWATAEDLSNVAEVLRDIYQRLEV